MIQKLNFPMNCSFKKKLADRQSASQCIGVPDMLPKNLIVFTEEVCVRFKSTKARHTYSFKVERRGLLHAIRFFNQIE